MVAAQGDLAVAVFVTEAIRIKDRGPAAEAVPRRGSLTFLAVWGHGRSQPPRLRGTGPQSGPDRGPRHHGRHPDRRGHRGGAVRIPRAVRRRRAHADRRRRVADGVDRGRAGRPAGHRPAHLGLPAGRRSWPPPLRPPCCWPSAVFVLVEGVRRLFEPPEVVPRRCSSSAWSAWSGISPRSSCWRRPRRNLNIRAAFLEVAQRRARLGRGPGRGDRHRHDRLAAGGCRRLDRDRRADPAAHRGAAPRDRRRPAGVHAEGLDLDEVARICSSCRTCRDVHDLHASQSPPGCRCSPRTSSWTTSASTTATSRRCWTSCSPACGAFPGVRGTLDVPARTARPSDPGASPARLNDRVAHGVAKPHPRSPTKRVGLDVSLSRL